MSNVTRFHADVALTPSAQRVEKRMLPARMHLSNFIRSTQDEKLKLDYARALKRYCESPEFPRVLKDLQAAAKPASRDEIVRDIGILTSSFPSMARADARAYGAVLAADIWAVRPSKYALDAAMTTLRRTATFSPSVGEVMETIADRETTLAANLRILDWLERLTVEAAIEIERLAGGGST